MSQGPGGTLGEFSNRVIIDPVQLQQFLESSEGPVFRYLVNVGELVKTEAKRRVRVYHPDPADPFAAKRVARRHPGTLRDGIVKRVARRPDGTPVILVGSDDPIALIEHDGTSAHPIVARKRPLLVFWSRKLHKVIAVKAVRHPGTKGSHFLTEAVKVIPK